MRRVCGCMSASSAATEIMNTPRFSSKWADTFARPVLRRLPVPASSLMSPSSEITSNLAASGGRLAQQSLARVVGVHRLRELAQRALLFPIEVVGDLDLKPVMD